MSAAACGCVKPEWPAVKDPSRCKLFWCKGCKSYHPWCKGGADDVRCDACCAEVAS